MDFPLSAAGSSDFGGSLAAKGIAASCEYVSMMTEAIEQRGREPFVAEHLDPFRERQVGGDDSRATLITFRFFAFAHQTGRARRRAAGCLQAS